MSHDLLDLPLLLQITQRLPRQTSVDLETVDERGNGDQAVGLHVFVEFVRGGFVEDDSVVGLVLDWGEGERLANLYDNKGEREQGRRIRDEIHNAKNIERA